MTDSSRARASWRPLANALSNWGAFAVSAVTAFCLSPFVVHSLGDESYGAWVLIGSVVSYLGLLDFGIRSAVTRYVANYQAASRHAEASRLVSAALLLFSLAGVVAVGAGGLLALWGLPHFGLPEHLLAPARVAVVLGSLAVAVSMVSGVFQGVVVGMQRFGAANSVGIASTLIGALAVVIGLSAGGELVTLAVIHLALNGAIALAMLRISRRVYPELRIRPGRSFRVEARTLLSFGLTTSVLHISGMLVHYSDPIVIGALLPLSQVTFFAIAASLIGYSRRVVSGISHLIAPLAASLDANDRAAEVREATLTGARFATLVSLTMIITFIWRGSSFIGLWMGPEYGSASGTVVAILAASRWCSASYQVTSNALIGLGRHRGLIPAAVIEAAANVMLSVWLAGLYGIVGVAIGTMIPRLVVTFGFAPWYMRFAAAIPARRYVLQTIIRPSVAMIPFALATVWIERTWPADGLVIFFGQVVLALPLAVAGTWVVALEASERALALRLVRGLRARS